MQTSGTSGVYRMNIMRRALAPRVVRRFLLIVAMLCSPTAVRGETLLAVGTMYGAPSPNGGFLSSPLVLRWEPEG